MGVSVMCFSGTQSSKRMCGQLCIYINTANKECMSSKLLHQSIWTGQSPDKRSYECYRISQKQHVITNRKWHFYSWTHPVHSADLNEPLSSTLGGCSHMWEKHITNTLGIKNHINKYNRKKGQNKSLLKLILYTINMQYWYKVHTMLVLVFFVLF